MAKLGSIPSHNYNLAESITAAKTLVNGDNGKVFYIDAADGAYTITLPSVRAGLHFRFFLTEQTPTGAVTIAAGSAIIFGWVAEAEVDTGDDAPGSATGTGVSNIIIGTGADKGLWLELHSNGTSWFVAGMTESDGDITTS